jgi:hypothetical protein
MAISEYGNEEEEEFGAGTTAQSRNSSHDEYNLTIVQVLFA